MSATGETIELKFERLIPAPAQKVFDAWLSTSSPGNPWSTADKAVVNPHVDGLFYLSLMGIGHYGRFVELESGRFVRHSWVSPATGGQETMVSARFTEKGNHTLMTLVHTGVPDNDKGRSHEGGWKFFLDKFNNTFDGIPA